MAKLKLNPESLRVESFASVPATPPRGTVAAYSFLTDPEPASQNCMETDYHWNTCRGSCLAMCMGTGAACTE